MILFCAGIAAFGQTTVKPKNPKYDAELAKRLGGDAMGLRSYVLAILKTGPKDAEIPAADKPKIFQGHFANMQRLAKEGSLVVAGPFADPERKFRGLFILNVKTVEEARKLVETDPVIKSGMMIAELVPWYGSAALLEVNNIHERIAQENP